MKEIVKVGIANKGEKNLEIEVVKTWVPKEINNFRDVVFFKHEDTYYTMKRDDFKRIYNL